MSKVAKKFVPAAGPSREVNDREIDPGLAAMRELYSLMIACRANGGARTTHVLPAVDAKRIEKIRAQATAEAFGIEIEVRGDGTVVSVWRPA